MKRVIKYLKTKIKKLIFVMLFTLLFLGIGCITVKAATDYYNHIQRSITLVNSKGIKFGIYVVNDATGVGTTYTDTGTNNLFFPKNYQIKDSSAFVCDTVTYSNVYISDSGNNQILYMDCDTYYATPYLIISSTESKPGYTINTPTITERNNAGTCKDWLGNTVTGSVANTSEIITSGSSIKIYLGGISNISKISFGYTANTYYVKYNANGGSGSMSNSTHTYDTSKTLTANTFTRTGYTFAGWNTKADGTGTHYANTASVKNLTTTNGATVNLYAQWTLNTYDIDYELNGGTNPSTAATSYNITSSTITLPTPTRTGYKFLGWYTTSDFSCSAVTTIASGSTGDKTYYAKWTRSLVIKVHANTNSADEVILSGPYGSTNKFGSDLIWSYSYGLGCTFYETTNTIYLSSYGSTYISRKGYSISNNEMFITAKGEVLSNNACYSDSLGEYALNTYNILLSYLDAGETELIVYLNWIPNTYEIKYDANGGSGTMSNSSHKYGTAQKLNANAFTKTGYKLLGWSTDSSATTPMYTDGQSVTNLSSTNGDVITLYAVWGIASYSITYDLDGGAATGNPTSYTMLSNSITLVNPTKTGFTFAGWTGSNGTTPQTTVTIAKGSTGNKTYKANWILTPFKVSVPKTIILNGTTGTATFKISSNLVVGKLKILLDDSFSLKQNGVNPILIHLSTNINALTPSNKEAVISLSSDEAIRAGTWKGSFNIGFEYSVE